MFLRGAGVAVKSRNGVLVNRWEQTSDPVGEDGPHVRDERDCDTKAFDNTLWELDGIIRTLYLLDYIDSPALRRNVQKALNRGEAYHQLLRAIAYARGGRFRVRSQHEQEVWNECARLIGNAVVYYNALILSEALAELELRGDLAAAEVLKRVSPVAWQHINFYGRYLFHEDFTPIDLERLRQQLSTEDVSRLYATG